MSPKSKGNKVPIESLKHQDKRANIPTEELRDFVKADENKPKTVEYPGLLYARDPSLDPQLVWKGKDEQDREPLTVPSVPVYIQEKIHPRYIIEDIRKHAKKGQVQTQADLFGDFNGVKNFEEMIDFYQHDVHWSNRMILGDSLLVMNSLAEKEGLKGKVQMIYMDPPYGIKFGSNWQVSTRKRDVKEKSDDATRQPEQVKAFRDTWQLGIHSYLSYLRDRLVVAREMLTETGSVFLQISDENIHLVRSLLDEVFGSENFCRIIFFQKTGSIESNVLGRTVDYILWYSKNIERVKFHPLFITRQKGDVSLERYDYIENEIGEIERYDDSKIQEGRRCRFTSLISDGEDKQKRSFNFQNIDYYSKSGSHWKTDPATGGQRLVKCNRISLGGSVLRYKRYFDDFPVIPIDDRWDSIQIGTELTYVVQTSIKVIERCVLMTTDPGDLVLDPTCGSGTTAYVAEQWGRRWITMDTSRVALALSRTRLMAAKYPYYLLSDSEPGIRKEEEITGKTPLMSLPKTEGDIRKGFVYKRVPHIMLKSIANNEEIDAIHAKWQVKLEPIRESINKALKQKWEEWEVPREAESGWSDKAKQLLAEWWTLRHERQKEMDETISRHGDSEFLYDQPYEDNKRIRVTGPFTVESLSPHRVLSTDEPRPVSEVEGKKQAVVGQFETTILDNLKKAGVQNTKKDERLKFDRLDSFAGVYVHAVGEYTDKGGVIRRVAVSIGPEHGTVGPEQVKEAAKEAMKGAGFDLLIVLGFAFDAHAGETVKEFIPDKQKPGEFAITEASRQYGKLPILLARMNPDLAMGDELLKKTGAGNLFMVFGEPDVEIKKAKDGQLTVKVKGVDVYDPTTGEVRSNKTDDIACWFIDTNYNGESFFVRHAYFTGAEEPYDKLKRALKAEIDESAWSALYKTESRPFDPPDTGKIAIKVINHYGDEVLKVYEIK
jgi:adenine-specific DNA-methyltransferase